MLVASVKLTFNDMNEYEKNCLNNNTKEKSKKKGKKNGEKEKPFCCYDYVHIGI